MPRRALAGVLQFQPGMVVIVIMLLRWIQRLSSLGRIGETIDQVERVTLPALVYRRDHPHLRAMPPTPRASGNFEVRARAIGYVRRIDLAALSAIADEHDCDIDVLGLPGAFVTPDRALLRLPGQPDEAIQRRLAAAFMIGDQRSFEQARKAHFAECRARRRLAPETGDDGLRVDARVSRRRGRPEQRRDQKTQCRRRARSSRSHAS